MPLKKTGESIMVAALLAAAQIGQPHAVRLVRSASNPAAIYGASRATHMIRIKFRNGGASPSL
jgi:hypothetical protein